MNISFFGTGLMGAPMIRVLESAGHELTVYNRTIEKAKKLESENVKAAGKVAEACGSSNVLIAMMSNAAALKETFMSDELNFAGKTFIQMGTIKPDESIEFKDFFESKNADYIEAPVLGSIPQIENRQLISIVGCSKELFENWNKLFSEFGEKIIYTGEVGTAAAMKLALNHLIASMTASFSMSLGFVREAGLDVEQFMDILRNSALYTPNFDKKLNNYLSDDYGNPNFPLKHLLKDVNLIQDAFNSKGINTLMLSGLIDILQKGINDGNGEQDYSVLYKSIHK